MSKFVFEGTEYASKTACAIHLVNDLNKTVKEAAATVGCSYQTIYVNTVGKEARAKQMAKLQAKRLISSKREYSKAEISRRTGLGEKTIRKLFTVVAGKPEVAPVAPEAAPIAVETAPVVA
jgi:predicted transcriptional regulator